MLLKVGDITVKVSDSAMPYFMTMYTCYLAEAFTLVYHIKHPETPILKTEITEGLPSFPLQCPLCRDWINRTTDVTYDFLFEMEE